MSFLAHLVLSKINFLGPFEHCSTSFLYVSLWPFIQKNKNKISTLLPTMYPIYIYIYGVLEHYIQCSQP